LWTHRVGETGFLVASADLKAWVFGQETLFLLLASASRILDF
jgi:hypothetical protein